MRQSKDKQWEKDAPKFGALLLNLYCKLSSRGKYESDRSIAGVQQGLTKRKWCQ